MDNNDFIKEWMEGKISREELEKRKSNGDAVVQQFDEIITRSSKLNIPPGRSKQEAWEKLSAKLDPDSKPETKVIKLNRWIPLSIAASVAVIIISFFVFSKTIVSTQMAETKQYTLPDGSEVFLNADSKIAFSRTGWESNRSVTLEGEAFFQVKKGSTFTVASDAGRVTVLGTSFNVNTRPSLFEVSCFTGKVKVASDGGEVMLTKGEFTRKENNTLTPAASFDDQLATWRNGEFYFERKPLGMVIDELERQFDVSIEFKGDATRLYTGYFSKKSLDEALEMVFKPMGLAYERRGDKNVIVR